MPVVTPGRTRSLLHVELFTAMALFGSTTPLSRIIAGDLPVFSAALLRMVLASSVLLCVAGRDLGRLAAARRRDWLAILGITGFGMVGFTATMLFGMRLTTGVVGATVMSATPAVTALAAVLFLGERFNRRKGWALALAVSGTVVINLGRGGQAGGGEAVVLGALLVALAVCFEAAYTLLSKLVAEGLSSLLITLTASLLAIPCFAVLALVFDPVPFAYGGATARVWLAVVFWGLAAGALAPVLWYRAVRRAPAVLAAGFMAVMPLSGLVLSYVVLGEPCRLVHLPGFGLAFAGVVLMIREHAGAAA